MNICHIKLITGEDLLGSVDDNTKDSVLINAPYVVEERINSSSGSTVMVLAPYAAYGPSQDIWFQDTHILFMTIASDEYKKFYLASKKYNEKYLQPAQMKELNKIVEAMEDVVDKKAHTSNIIKLSSIGVTNTSFH
jgi:hypothetical protein